MRHNPSFRWHVLPAVLLLCGPAIAATKVEVRVVPLSAASASGTSVAPPGPWAGPAHINQTFVAELWAKNVGDPLVGITGGTVDVQYTTSLADATTVTVDGSNFPLYQSGTIVEASGLVDDVGGGTLQGNVGVSQWVRLATINMSAKAVGTIAFQLQPGALNFALYDQGNVAWSDVSLGTASLPAVRTLTGLAVSSGPNQVNEGATALYTATASYDDGSTAPVTSLVTWSVQPNNLGTIAGGTFTASSNIASDTNGTISASYTESGVTKPASKGITVKNVRELVGLTISGPNEVNEGATASYTATASYDDGSTADVTSQATWTATTGAIASGAYTAPSEISSHTSATISATYTEPQVSESDDAIVVIGNTLANLSVQTIAPDGQPAGSPIRSVHQLGATLQVPAPDPPGACQIFDHWTGDVPTGHETDNPLALQMLTDKTLRAEYKDIPTPPCCPGGGCAATALLVLAVRVLTGQSRYRER